MDRMEQLRDEASKDLAAELRDLIPLLSAARGIVSHSPSSQIVVQAGGIAVWLAVTACVVMVAVTLSAVVFIGLGLSDLNRQTQELRQTDQTIQAYINAGLVQPEEKPK